MRHSLRCSDRIRYLLSSLITDRGVILILVQVDVQLLVVVGLEIYNGELDTFINVSVLKTSGFYFSK